MNIADSFLGVLAQRLVRRLCKKCHESYNPTQDEFDDIEADFGKKALAMAGYTYSSRMELFRSLGCESCSGSGYKGRMGIHELLVATDEVKRLAADAGIDGLLFTGRAAVGKSLHERFGGRTGKILALEMGADAEDISKTIHAHPTLSETFALAAEIVDGSITDALPPKKK